MTAMRRTGPTIEQPIGALIPSPLPRPDPVTPLVLPHHHCVERAVRLGKGFQQGRRLRPVPPRQAPAEGDVKD